MKQSIALDTIEVDLDILSDSHASHGNLQLPALQAESANKG
jgi:hypothetical protein